MIPPQHTGRTPQSHSLLVMALYEVVLNAQEATKPHSACSLPLVMVGLLRKTLRLLSHLATSELSEFLQVALIFLHLNCKIPIPQGF